MATVVSAQIGAGQLAKGGEEQIAAAVFWKGKSFIGSALLLRQHGGSEYVVLHLLAQGVELILKSILLANDYKLYEPQLRRLGHNLLAAADEVAKATSLLPVSGRTKIELVNLSRLYQRHVLRYGSLQDIFIVADSIPSSFVLRGVAGLIKWAEKKEIFCELVI